MEGRLEINPVQLSGIVLGSGEDVGDKVVLVKVPAVPEDIQDVEY